jgi:hypothetical protein
MSLNIDSPGNRNASRNLRESFDTSERSCIKLDSYFQDYDELFQKIKSDKPTIVEIGILDGGSLLMWRNYFGPGARIIGLEKNPKVLEIENLGFEIYIVDQEIQENLSDVLAMIGNIDVLIDDGSHTSKGQISTCLASYRHMKNSGLIVVEDTHTSFAKDFGMPHKYSFANWVFQIQKLMDQMYIFQGNPKSQDVKNKNQNMDFAKSIREIRKYRSMTVFEVQHNLENPVHINNQKSSSNIQDVRWIQSGSLLTKLLALSNFLRWDYSSAGGTHSIYKIVDPWTRGKKAVLVRSILQPLGWMNSAIVKLYFWLNNQKLSKYFH